MGAVYTQPSLKERRRIEDLWHARVPVREMARVLKRSKSTIHREIKRNFWSDDAFPKKYAGYFGSAAQLQSQRRRSVQRKLIRHPELCKSVVSRIKQGWTPYQKGTVENTNNRLRKYLPRSTEPTVLTNRYLRSICQRLNSTPRKCLGYRTPAEVFEAKLLGIQNRLE